MTAKKEKLPIAGIKEFQYWYISRNYTDIKSIIREHYEKHLAVILNIYMK